jgi:hypothetical protein
VVAMGKPAPSLLSKKNKLLNKSIASKKVINTEGSVEQEKKIQEQAARITALEKELADLTEHFKREHALRKKYMNEVEQAKGNMRVYVRIRPFNRMEQERQAKSAVKVISGSSILQVENNRGVVKDFDFNGVFDQSASQEEVFNEIVKDSMRSAFDGLHVCYMVYGQAGAGKSHTMVGYNESVGIIPRAIEEVYRIVDELTNSDRMNCLVVSSFVELYLDNIRDLYWFAQNEKTPSQDTPKWDIKLDANKSVYVQNALVRVATTKDELLTHYQEGSNMRTIGSTQMNGCSSRGHSLFFVVIECYDKITKQTNKGKLVFVDLAGLERNTKTGASGERLKESAANNRAFGALGDVLTALADENQKFIPYRNSKLTQILQDSLGGNAKTHMIVNISPADIHSDESITALAYGQRARKATSNGSKTNDSEEVARLKAIIANLNNGNNNVTNDTDGTTTTNQLGDDTNVNAANG